MLIAEEQIKEMKIVTVFVCPVTGEDVNLTQHMLIKPAIQLGLLLTTPLP